VGESYWCPPSFCSCLNWKTVDNPKALEIIKKHIKTFFEKSVDGTDCIVPEIKVRNFLGAIMNFALFLGVGIGSRARILCQGQDCRMAL
jgi:hypothetical protein